MDEDFSKRWVVLTGVAEYKPLGLPVLQEHRTHSSSGSLDLECGPEVKGYLMLFLRT